MIPVPSGGKVWLALGHTDMRKGMRSLALQVQEALKKDVHAGDLYVFRGRSGALCKILWHVSNDIQIYGLRRHPVLRIQAAAIPDVPPRGAARPE